MNDESPTGPLEHLVRRLLLIVYGLSHPWHLIGAIRMLRRGGNISAPTAAHDSWLGCSVRCAHGRDVVDPCPRCERAYRELIEQADVMKQWGNPCVREAAIDYQRRRFTDA